MYSHVMLYVHGAGQIVKPNHAEASVLCTVMLCYLYTVQVR